MFGRKSTRDIVIANKETLKNISDNFTDHITSEEKKFDQLFTEIKSCPETPHIKKQNSKIDKLIDKTDKIEVAVIKITNTKTTRMDVKSEIIKLIWMAAVIIGTVIGILTYLDRNKIADAAEYKTGLLTQSTNLNSARRYWLIVWIPDLSAGLLGGRKSGHHTRGTKNWTPHTEYKTGLLTKVRANSIRHSSIDQASRLIQCKNYCCQRLIKSAGELCPPEDDNIWTGEYKVLLHSPTCKKALEQAEKHNKTLRFFMSDDPEEIKRMMPGNVKAEVVVCQECRLIREDDGNVCKAVCCMYYGWIVEKPRTAHRQDCSLLKHRELRNLKLVCLTCLPDKATLVEKGFHLCPTCFKLGTDNPPRKKRRHRRTGERPPVLAYYRQ